MSLAMTLFPVLAGLYLSSQWGVPLFKKCVVGFWAGATVAGGIVNSITKICTFYHTAPGQGLYHNRWKARLNPLPAFTMKHGSDEHGSIVAMKDCLEHSADIWICVLEGKATWHPILAAGAYLWADSECKIPRRGLCAPHTSQLCAQAISSPRPFETAVQANG
ncbi:hypothetical protein DFP73DRAFT_532073 [Morchella snyderi]|nr:hypothetical protein DFP73DRAFT_532073 [Morchella snyderi]